jgi:hypothetical protein
LIFLIAIGVLALIFAGAICAVRDVPDDPVARIAREESGTDGARYGWE